MPAPGQGPAGDERAPMGGPEPAATGLLHAGNGCEGPDAAAVRQAGTAQCPPGVRSRSTVPHKSGIISSLREKVTTPDV